MKTKYKMTIAEFIYYMTASIVCVIIFHYGFIFVVDAMFSRRHYIEKSKKTEKYMNMINDNDKYLDETDKIKMENDLAEILYADAAATAANK